MKKNHVIKPLPALRVVSVFIIVISLPFLQWGQEDKTRSLKPDFQIKASLLRSCASFCYWPTHSNISDLKKEFTIGYFEDSEMTEFLQDKLISQSFAGKKTRMLYISKDEEIRNCNIILIPDYSEKRINEILQFVGDLPIMTVSEKEEHVKLGIMINMFPKNKKIVYNVNRTFARKNGIDFSSKLLKYAVEIL